MKKLYFLVGVGVGFLLGSRVGREPYEKLEAQVRQLAGRPEVKDAVNTMTEKASDLTDSASAAVTQMVPGTGGSRGGGPTGSIDQSEIDAETNAAIDQDLVGTFPTSDPSSSWAGGDVEP